MEQLVTPVKELLASWGKHILRSWKFCIDCGVRTDGIQAVFFFLDTGVKLILHRDKSIPITASSLID